MFTPYTPPHPPGWMDQRAGLDTVAKSKVLVPSSYPSLRLHRTYGRRCLQPLVDMTRIDKLEAGDKYVITSLIIVCAHVTNFVTVIKSVRI
jgi:hypothetical protein